MSVSLVGCTYVYRPILSLTIGRLEFPQAATATSSLLPLPPGSLQHEHQLLLCPASKQNRTIADWNCFKFCISFLWLLTLIGWLNSMSASLCSPCQLLNVSSTLHHLQGDIRKRQHLPRIKDHQRMMVDPMFMIFQNATFPTAVTPTAVTPTAVI